MSTFFTSSGALLLAAVAERECAQAAPADSQQEDYRTGILKGGTGDPC